MFNKFSENFNLKKIISKVFNFTNIDISRKFTGLIRIMIIFEILTKFIEHFNVI